MALVKADGTENCIWNVRESSNVRNKLPKATKNSAIDYNNLQWLCNINGLKSRDSSSGSTEEAHKIFMQNYRKMFIQKPAKFELPCSENRTGLSLGTSLKNETSGTNMPDHKLARKVNTQHKIPEHLPLLRKERKSSDPMQVKMESIRTLRHILRKKPFERTAGENEKIFSALLNFDLFHDKIEQVVLRDLCAVAQLETWKDANFSVYGKTGVHFILKGSVIAQSEPHLVLYQEGSSPQKFASLGKTDLYDTSKRTLSVGDCFGTWLLFDEPYTKEFSVVTSERNCEFMKICSSDYNRVLGQIKQREHTEKLNLLISCDQYRKWPRQPLITLADSIEWVTYPPSTVLASENNKSPFIGFILSGECHVLRWLEVLHGNKSDKKCMKQVVMGRLGPSDSFAEISLILDEPITCTIVTATEVKLGVVRPEKLRLLDEVTRQLIVQSSTRTYGNLTKEQIQDEYLQQEVKRKWNEFKHAQVLEVINAYGIQPGYRRWKK